MQYNRYKDISYTDFLYAYALFCTCVEDYLQIHKVTVRIVAMTSNISGAVTITKRNQLPIEKMVHVNSQLCK